jgi:hypothetical protein
MCQFHAAIVAFDVTILNYYIGWVRVAERGCAANNPRPACPQGEFGVEENPARSHSHTPRAEAS